VFNVNVKKRKKKNKKPFQDAAKKGGVRVCASNKTNQQICKCVCFDTTFEG